MRADVGIRPYGLRFSMLQQSPSVCNPFHAIK